MGAPVPSQFISQGQLYTACTIVSQGEGLQHPPSAHTAGSPLICPPSRPGTPD